MSEPPILSRRALLGGALTGAAAVGLAACSSSTATPASSSTTSLPARPTARLVPGDLPNPAAAVGTDQLPQIKNIVVVMMENHSYDNVLEIGRAHV